MTLSLREGAYQTVILGSALEDEGISNNVAVSRLVFAGPSCTVTSSDA
jgi:hypothetical protein